MYLRVYIGILNENRSTFLDSENGWRLFEALGSLTEGKEEKIGLSGSKNAIYQFYKSEAEGIKKRRENCPEDREELSSESREIYENLFPS